jgi:hypothetical protein
MARPSGITRQIALCGPGRATFLCFFGLQRGRFIADDGWQYLNPGLVPGFFVPVSWPCHGGRVPCPHHVTLEAYMASILLAAGMALAFCIAALLIIKRENAAT